MFKKIASILLALVLVLLLPTVAFAAVGDNMYDETEPNNYMSSAKRMYQDYTVSGSLDGADMDYFKFVLTGNAKVEFLAMASRSYVLAGILDTSGDFVAAAEGYYDDGYYWDVAITTLSAGTYYLVLFPDSASNYYYNISYTFYFNYTYTTPSHTHSYTSKVTAPTCTEQGYTTYTCSCGYSYKSNYTAARHTAGTPVKENVVASTCIAEGTYDDAVYCTVCGEWILSEIKKTPINPNAHKFDDAADQYCNLCGSERPDYVIGDTTGDTNIDNKDYALLMQYLNGWEVTIILESADTTGDGNVDNKDYALLMQYLNGWDVQLSGGSSDSSNDNSNTETVFKDWSVSELYTLQTKTQSASDDCIDLTVEANSAKVFIGSGLGSMASDSVAKSKNYANNIYNALLTIKPYVEANKDLAWVDIDGTTYYLKENFNNAWETVNALIDINLSVNSSSTDTQKYVDLVADLNFYCMVMADIAENQ